MADSLNGVMEDVGAVMGFQAASRLIAVFGGRSLYVPGVITSEHPIALVVGKTAAKRLAEAFGSETLDIPSHEEFFRLRRVSLVAELTRRGCSARLISERVGVSVRHVGNCRRKAEALGLLKTGARA